MFTNQEAATVSGEQLGFSFGENWECYVVTDLTAAAIENAEKSFVAFTRLSSLQDQTFLDIGCGSGLSSLVAYRLGAKRILSIDVDPHSINCVTSVREKFARGTSTWEVRHGSVLDQEFMTSLGCFSYVYSWGVLHHTGSMWPAIHNAISCVEPTGKLHLALYNEYKHAPKWLTIKRLCNRYPQSVFPVLKAGYGAYSWARLLMRLQSPVTYMRQYRENRGMSFWRDIEDRLGGLPYEYCTPDAVVDCLADRGFVLQRLKTSSSFGCNEFLFGVVGQPSL